MRSLGLALFAEGPTDRRFLAPVLRRATEDMCLREADDIVEIGDVLQLQSHAQTGGTDRGTRILEAAREAGDAYGLLFIHADGGGDPDSAVRERVDPAARLVASDLARPRVGIVAVVPVRETEAWTLVDGDALREAFGTLLDDSGLGIPARSRDVESLPDPKQSLDRAFGKVVGARRRKKKAADFLDAIGERVQLTHLRALPAFQRFERDLRAALLALRYLGQDAR